MIELPPDKDDEIPAAADPAGGNTLAMADAEARPAVGKRTSALSTALIAFCITLIGFGLFSAMNAHRTHRRTPEAGTAQFAVAEPPVQMLQLTAEPRAAQYTIPGPQFTTSNVSRPIGPLPTFNLPPIGVSDPAQRRRAPALVVDLGGGPDGAIVNTSLAAPSAAAAALAKGAGGGAAEAAEAAQVSAEERFAERVGGQDADRVKATAMKHLDLLIPQGNVIPAVLETALNSDLPGFTRAVVSRDVRSFDGSTVLIPRGSRLIGQYKSGVALGQARVFVIWTRVIRPDGVSVQIGSPVTDPLGRAGLDGKVDNHFFTRFGGSILLSVMNAGLTALTTRATGSQIYIGSPTDASNVATVAIQKDSGRPPTIQTPQGTPISIFVARDLDFTGVENVRPMNAPAPPPTGVYLQTYLAPFAPLLGRADVTDVFVNRAGEAWVETIGGGLERHDVPELDETTLWRLARQVASGAHQGISREHPLLAASLPDGARVQVIAPPATRAGVVLAIRKHVVADLTLDDYIGAGAFQDVAKDDSEAEELDRRLQALLDAGEVAGFLRAAVKGRKNIVVAGGTSTGKTTFLNALLKEIPTGERLIIIEDTPEVRIEHPNAIGLVAVRGELGESRVTPEDLLQASLRMRPDRIIMGELRGAEAYSFLRAVNTGHPGSVTTVHADSPRGAVDQLALMVMQAGSNLSRAEIVDYIRNVVGVFVQLSRSEGRRAVSRIAFEPRRST